MTTNIARRYLGATGALALLDTAMTGGVQAQSPTGVEAGSGDSKAKRSGPVKTRTASCNCGQLRVTTKGPDPDRVVICHCNLCQKQSGTVFSLQARFPNEEVTIEGKSTTWAVEGAKLPYRTCATGDVITFHFCPECASTVYYYRKSDPARTGVKVGTFAEPEFPPPIGSGLEEFAHPWAMKVASLPMPLGHHK